MKTKIILILLTALCGGLWGGAAYAARNATFTQTSPAPPGVFDMGSTQTLTFSVANANTAGNVGERMYAVRFRINNGSTFAASTAAPAGWTRTAFSATSVTFTATSWANAIQTGSSMSFNLDIAIRRTTADDTSETLRDGRGSFTTDTNFTNGITNAGTNTDSAIGSWQMKSLQIVSFQTTDTSGVATSTILAGQSFRVVITVRNNSTATMSSITSNPNPPTATKTGTVTNGLTSTVYSPNPLTLAANATGTITFTYTTNVSDNGTIFFTVSSVRNSAFTGTSKSATSNTLTVSGGQFIANVTAPSCLYIGQTFTVSMELRNSNAYAINNIAPTMNASVAGIVTLTSGPTPATRNIAAGTPATPTVIANAFQWTYQVTGGTTGQIFTMNGSASGTAQAPGSGTKTTPVDPSANIRRAGFSPTPSPTAVNASSTRQEITWVITNAGCSDAQSVAIAIPAGWTVAMISGSPDAYSLIDNTDESWVVSGTGPVTFTSPAAGNNLLFGDSATFSIVFDTPTTTGAHTFNFTITDTALAVASPATSVTVNPFKSGTPSANDTFVGGWRETFK